MMAAQYIKAQLSVWLILVSLVFCGCLMMCCVVTLESQSYTSNCHINVKESKKKKSQNRSCYSLEYKVALIRINVSKKIWVGFLSFWGSRVEKGLIGLF